MSALFFGSLNWRYQQLYCIRCFMSLPLTDEMAALWIMRQLTSAGWFHLPWLKESLEFNTPLSFIMGYRSGHWRWVSGLSRPNQVLVWFWVNCFTFREPLCIHVWSGHSNTNLEGSYTIPFFLSGSCRRSLIKGLKVCRDTGNSLERQFYQRYFYLFIFYF
jgi:hypothetical protein